MKQTHIRIVFQSICLLSLAGALNVQAANVTKLDTTSMAATTANWSAAPAATDIGEFNATPSVASLSGLTLGGADLPLGGLLFDNNMQGAATIAAGNNLILGASGINMSAALTNVTISCAVVLSNAQNWNVVSPQVLTVGGAVTITNLLTLNGSGTVALTAANIGTNGVTLNSGTLFLGNSSAVGVGPFPGGTLTLAGGTVQMVGLTITNPVNLIGTTTLSNGLSASTFQSGYWTGAGTLNVYAATNSTVTFNGTSILTNFAGTVKVMDTVTNIYIRMSICTGSTAATFDLGNGYLVYLHTRTGNAVNLGALKGGPNTTVMGERSATAVGTPYTIGYNNASTVFYGLMTNGINTGNSWVSLTKVGTGTLTLAGTNCYLGPTTVLAGTLALSNGASLSGGLGLPNYSTNIIVAGGATLDVSGLSSIFTLVSGQVLSNSASATGILKGNMTTSAGSTVSLSYVAGTPALTMAGGTLTLNSGTTVKVNNTGGVLAPGSYLLISSTGGAVAIGGIFPPAVTVTGGNGNYSSTTTLYVSGGQLYLWVNPVAENFTLMATVGTPVTVPVIPKFASSANGDKLTLTISGDPTNGTATVTGSSNIVYTATGGGANDSFNYTVTDSSYGTAASATVTVTNNQTGQSYNTLNPPVVNGNGTVTLSFLGFPTETYALDWTHSLVPPVTWLPVVSNTAAANGIMLFTNTPSGSNDFYRTRFVHP